jgi:hypothetical protein
VHCVSNFIVLYGELHHLMLCNIQNADTLICSVAKIKHGKYESELNESPQSVIMYMFGVEMGIFKNFAFEARSKKFEHKNFRLQTSHVRFEHKNFVFGKAPIF